MVTLEKDNGDMSSRKINLLQLLPSANVWMVRYKIGLCEEGFGEDTDV